MKLGAKQKDNILDTWVSILRQQFSHSMKS